MLIKLLLWLSKVVRRPDVDELMLAFDAGTSSIVDRVGLRRLAAGPEPFWGGELSARVSRVLFCSDEDFVDLFEDGGVPLATAWSFDGYGIVQAFATAAMASGRDVAGLERDGFSSSAAARLHDASFDSGRGVAVAGGDAAGTGIFLAELGLRVFTEGGQVEGPCRQAASFEIFKLCAPLISSLVFVNALCPRLALDVEASRSVGRPVNA